MTDRKKPGVAFWATVVVVVALVGYPLSWGPVLYLEMSGWISPSLIGRFYAPVGWLLLGPGKPKWFLAYLTWWMQRAVFGW